MNNFSPDSSIKEQLGGQALSGDVYERILSDLMMLNIEPGERLSVDSLARRMGVSQTPIRQALGRLESEGLVTSAHLKGFRATGLLTRPQLDALLEVRLLLEPFAARSAASTATDEQIAQIAEAVQAMASGDGVSPQDARSYAEADAHIHALVAEAGGNPIVRDTLSRLHSHLHIFRLRRDAVVVDEANAEHKILIEAIARRDAHGADAAMRTHIEKARDRILETVWRDS
ncbi:GntR family transcriptional regulator [Mycobacterium sp. AMU20-3851]|uniref:GntR family transcriptional regulator n=1 Tax=Mycobacterium sp. AMU20-3851 TaxID=3122055 RepID=UPI003754E88C